MNEIRMNYLKAKGTIVSRMVKVIRDYTEDTQIMREEMGLDKEEVEFRLKEVWELKGAVDEYVKVLFEN